MLGRRTPPRAAPVLVAPAPARPKPEPEPGGRGDAEQVVASSPALTSLRERLVGAVQGTLPLDRVLVVSRKDVADCVSDRLVELLAGHPAPPGLIEQRHLVTAVIGDLMAAAKADAARRKVETEAHQARDEAARLAALQAITPASLRDPEHPAPRPVSPAALDTTAMGGPAPARTVSRSTVEEAKHRIQPVVLDRIDAAEAAALEPDALRALVDASVLEVRQELQITLNRAEHNGVVDRLIDDMIGLGPLEPLLADEAISDIMVNGPNTVFVERQGKVALTDVRFQSEAQLRDIAQRIVTKVGRRVDDSSPICDARLMDGSRVNVITTPLAIDGTTISIRKFAKRKIGLDDMVDKGSASPPMALLLKIAARSRLNIIVSGGTGSGKTTLLNALSRLIDHGERVVTIEDAAELQLQQPHVVRLETRPPSLEGRGEIGMRDLVKNALRMRPDRIILGEVRGGEALDMLQAMNTGHEGSMCTLHANSPRDALVRLENLVSMSGVSLPARAIRQQVAAAVDLIVQVARMRDGKRRITQVTEITGMEGEVVVTQDLFGFKFEGQDTDGTIKGQFASAGARPHFLPKAEYFGLDRALMEVM